MCLVGNYQSTVTVHHISSAMASRDSRPKADQSGICFRNQLQVPWNAPESIRGGCIGHLGHPRTRPLQARNDCAEPTRVLPGRAQNSVWALIPDNRAAPWGFHDVTLVDMAGATGPSISNEDLSSLRRQWPISLVARMSKRPCARALHRIVSITSARNTMWVILSRRPVWRNGFQLGLQQELSGTQHWSLRCREYTPTLLCSAIPNMEPRWFTITGCPVIVRCMHLCVDHL